MIKRRIIISSLMLLFISGCVGPTCLDENFGRSLETARYNQTLNVDAAENLEPVEGIDGEKAMNTVSDYRKASSQNKTSGGITE